MNRRHADPAELARTSRMVKAWDRRTREKAQGDELYDEHWYAFLLTMARPVPGPSCSICEDCGLVTLACTIENRCNSRTCERPDRRSDRMHTHEYVRPCLCAAGEPYQRSFAHAWDDEGAGRSQRRTPKVNFSQAVSR